MTRGHEEGWNWDTPAIRRLTDIFVQLAGPERIPTVRRITKQREQEVRRKEQEAARRKERVDALVAMLRVRSISLPAAIRNKLNRLSLNQLPSLRTAERAKDAEDFARKAGLV